MGCPLVSGADLRERRRGRAELAPAPGLGERPRFELTLVLGDGVLVLAARRPGIGFEAAFGLADFAFALTLDFGTRSSRPRAGVERVLTGSPLFAFSEPDFSEYRTISPC